MRSFSLFFFCVSDPDNVGREKRALESLSDDDLAIVLTRHQEEQIELETGLGRRETQAEELQGRQSGSEEWRRERGEIGSSSSSSLSCQSLVYVPSFDLALNEKVVDFSSFDEKPPMNFVQHSHFDQPSRRLIVVPARNDASGAIWLQKKISPLHGFEVNFAFEINKSGADGFAFVLVC